MFIILSHQKLDVYKVSKQLVYEIYQFSRLFPSDERFGIVSQIKRAALSVHLNIAEGFSRRSAVERSRFHEIARGSLIEIDAALDLAHQLNYFQASHAENIGKLMKRCFSMLNVLIAYNRYK